MQHTLADHVHLAVTMTDGSITVIGFLVRGTSPTLPIGAEWIDQKLGLWHREPTNANLFAEIEKIFSPTDPDGKRILEYVRYKVVPSETIPQDRTYRAALTFDGTALSFDLEKAKTIHLDRIRAARNEKLNALDKDWMRATGQDDKVLAAAIEAQRQVLRDIPQTMDLDQAQTVDALKALWPAELPRR